MTERGEQAGSAPGRTTVLEGSDAALGAAGRTGARVGDGLQRRRPASGSSIALRPAAGGPPPVNNEPTFDQNVPDQTNAEGAVINLDAGATDLDGDPLTYAATGLPAGLSINTSTGLITGTIAFTAAASSPYSVSVTVRDGATVDATDTFQWTVTNVNREPTFDQNLGNRTDVEGAVISLDAGATDPDGDPLIYAATNLPPGLSISPTTGLITGTIDATAAAGSPYSVSITVRDGPTVDATDTFTWTVTDVPPPNQPPTFDQDLGSRTDAEGAVITLDAGATDPEGDPLTYAATGLPAGLSIDTSTGLITGTIAFTAAAGSPYNVSVTVRDGPTVDATDTFQWTVTNVNLEPTFDQNLPNRTDPEGAVINLDAGATDLDGDPLTYARHGSAGRLVDQYVDRPDHRHHQLDRCRRQPVQRVDHGPRWRDGRRHRRVHLDGDRCAGAQPATDVRPEPAQPDRPRGRGHQPRRGCHRPRRRPADVRRHEPAAGLSINTGTGLITGTIGSTAAACSPYSVSITVSDSPPGVDATDTFTWTVTDVPPGSGIAFRAVSFGSNNASTTSINLARPTGTLTGDVMLALLDVRGTSTVTAPAGWTLIRTDTYTASLRMHAYWRVATGSDPTSWTWTFSGSRLAAGAIHAYSGVIPPTRSIPRAAARPGRVGHRDRAVDHHHRGQHDAGRLLRQPRRLDLDSAGRLHRAGRPDRYGTDPVHLAAVGRRASSGHRRHRPGIGHCVEVVGQRCPAHRPATGLRRAAARQQRADVRSEPAQPDRSRGRGHQPRRGCHRPRRRSADIRRHGSAGRACRSIPRPA